MAKLLRPKVIIPLVFSMALLAGMLAFADIGKVITLMMNFQHIYLLYFLLLMVAYEAIRGVQWHVLLRALDIQVPLRAQIFTFVAGEATKSLPIGNYFQNYLLQVSRGTDFGRSSAATTLIIFIEVAVSLVGVVILGVGTLTWVRPVILVGSALAALVAWAIVKIHRTAGPPAWMTRHDMLRKGLEEFRRFWEGAADLMHPRVLLIAGILGALYLCVAAIAFYLVALGLGVQNLTLGQAMAVYFFGLAVGLIFPLPVDIGVNEASSVGAFLAVGVSRTAAVSIALINRVLSIGAALAIALASLVVLHDELGAVLAARSGQRPSSSPSSETVSEDWASDHAPGQGAR